MLQKTDKGKLSERIGRKVMGLKHFKCQDCQTADFFCFSSEVLVIKVGSMVVDGKNKPYCMSNLKVFKNLKF